MLVTPNVKVREIADEKSIGSYQADFDISMGFCKAARIFVVAENISSPPDRRG